MGTFMDIQGQEDVDEEIEMRDVSDENIDSDYQRDCSVRVHHCPRRIFRR